MTAPTTICAPIAPSQITGPQPRSASCGVRPMSVPRSPVPQRRLANQHHHSDGPYPIVASRATYSATGQPNPTIASRTYFDTISEPLRTPTAPTAATNGNVGAGGGTTTRTACVKDPTAVPGMGGGSVLIDRARTSSRRRQGMVMTVQKVPAPPDA